jgi:hypothetical protein
MNRIQLRWQLTPDSSASWSVHQHPVRQQRYRKDQPTDERIDNIENQQDRQHCANAQKNYSQDFSIHPFS